jgi:hypothetical protein
LEEEKDESAKKRRGRPKVVKATKIETTSIQNESPAEPVIPI